MVWDIWDTTVIFLLLPWWTFWNKSIICENKKETSFLLKCYYSKKKYLLKWKQHGLPDALSKEFSFKCFSVMIYEQFIVSIVELIMLSWQPILLHNFHNMRVPWLFYHFFKLQVHILHGLENISIFNLWKLWNCNLSRKLVLTLFSMGHFKNTTVLGGALWPPLVTSLFLKVEGQNLVAWGILMCLLQKWH